MAAKTKILIVEHDPDDLELVLYELKKDGIELLSKIVQNEQDYIDALTNFRPDIILSDYSLPSFDGPTAFRLREAMAPDTPFIFVSGYIGEENSVEFIKSGVTDYALKDKLFTLPTKVRRALKESKERQLKKTIEQEQIKGENRLKDAQTIAHLGSWEIDMVSHTQTWSDELFNIFGVKKGEVLPSTNSYLSFVHPDDLDFVNGKVKTAFSKIADSSYDFRFFRHDGALRHGYAKSHFEFDRDHRPLRRYGIIQDVTEKKQAEEALLKSEANLRAIFDNTDTAFILIDSQFNIQSFNKTFSLTTQREFGKTPVEGESILSIVSKERLEEIKGAFEKVLQGDALEFDLEFNPGEGKWYHCRFIPVSDKHAVVIGIMTAITDITERKEAENQKEFDRNNLKALLNNTNDLMWSLDRDFKLITSNHAFDEMVKLLSGITPTRGSDILLAGVNAGQVRRFKNNYERAFLGESFTEIEYTYFPADYWSEISYYPIYKEGGVVGTACFSRNITEQKMAENHLRLLESVITNTNDSVLITEAEPIDEPGPRIVYVNEAFTKMTDYQREEVIGKNPRFLQGLKTDRQQLNRIRAALSQRQSVEVEIINYKKTGEEFWNNFTIVPVVDKDGNLTHCVSIQRDVTARRGEEEISRMKLEKLVAERTHELNEALTTEKDVVEMKNKFVSIASHEFRTPLSTISFAAESIRNYFHQLTADEIRRKLIKIEDQASHMTNLLDDILTLGKSDAGKIKVKRVSLDLKAFISTLIEEVRATVKETREINFTYLCASHMVNADDKLLRNVINNLLTNALKFSAANNSVAIVVSDLGGEVLIKVTDQGIGIEENELASIFESFQRGSNASAVQGTGLGLSILKKAVELMEGSIEVKSVVNHGSTFSVMIPTK